MTICAVTDRRRLCATLTPAFERSREALRLFVELAVRTGIDIVQIRERDLEARELTVLVDDAVRATRRTGTRIVVNDRVDVALACGADGVHLRSDSVPASAVRGLAPAGFLVGRSVHSIDEARAAGPVDYLIAGTVFSTPSKPGGGPLVGVAGLRGMVSAVDVPVLAIGGITLDTVDLVAGAGAAGIAAIGAFLGGTQAVEQTVRTLRSRFDSLKPAS